MTARAGYPDILGSVTGGDRLNVDVIQCATATRPSEVFPGQHFELLFLIQNASDINIDVTLTLYLHGYKHILKSQSDKVLVGIEPGEVGYVTLPIACSAEATPQHAYPIAIEISVTHLTQDRQLRRIRSADGGGEVNFRDLTLEQRRLMMNLRNLDWYARAYRRNQIDCQVTVAPPNGSQLAEPRVGWASIWALGAHLDDTGLIESVQQDLYVLFEKLQSKVMLKPVLDATTQYVHLSGKTLHPAEALTLAKWLTSVLSHGYVDAYRLQTEQATNKRSDFRRMTTEMIEQLKPPTWVRKSAEMLYKEPRFRDYPNILLRDHIFFALVYDAVLAGFQTLGASFPEVDLGTHYQRTTQAQAIRDLLETGKPLTLEQLYLPLILAGMGFGTPISLGNETPRETLYAITKIYQQRQPQNPVIATLFEKISNRILDTTL